MSQAQVDNRLPFRQRVGNPAPENNLFRIKGDFTIIGNTNLTLAEYDDNKENSLKEMVFVDIDQDESTANSSSATLVFSQENGADPTCSDILYAGLYWSGRAKEGLGLTFDVLQGYLPGEPQHIDKAVQQLYPYDSLHYSNFSSYSFSMEDDIRKLFPYFILTSKTGLEDIVFEFRNEGPDRVRVGYGGFDNMQPVTGLEISQTDTTIIATFDQITFSENGMLFYVDKMTRSVGTDYESFINEHNSVEVTISGTFIPQVPQIKRFDKRKVKIKGPSTSDYTEITASGNQILFPAGELRDMYVGYADITQYVKNNGTGIYTVADLALTGGMGDATGNYGHWGLVVVYQNPAMHWRDVTVFDGYAFVQALNFAEHTGEIAIEGFETIKQGPVNLKLGVMAGEGDRTIEGDFLEIINQQGEWTRLSHPLNSVDNFFNSSIYTPVTNRDGILVQNPRYPELLNNTGIDIVQWEIPNPNNSIIGNSQTSTRFRFGTKQDIYNIYAMAFSVRSYLPEIQALNQLTAINGIPPPDNPSVRPGEEMTFSLEIRNRGNEETSETHVVIPLPYNATYVDAQTSPADHGSIRFDPDLGVAGSLIWEIGPVPVVTNSEVPVASMQYTLRVTEDCALLANNQCEATIAVRGGIYGTGKTTQSTFANIPFIQGIEENACAGKEIIDPLELALTDVLEFVQAQCGDMELAPGLGPIELPDFCRGDSPVDLSTFIKPTRAEFSIFYFSDEQSESPFYEYTVNTSLIGTDTVWVAEGPSITCTGLRVPVRLNVRPRSPSPNVFNQLVCSEESFLGYGIQHNGTYELLYYPDNKPESNPISGAQSVDLTMPGTYTVWVSQLKEGECESLRREVKIEVRDCSLFGEINVKIQPDIQAFSAAGEVVVYTIELTNTGKIMLSDVYLMESQTNSVWDIPLLEVGERMIFTVAYTITPDDLTMGSLYNYVYTTGHANGYGDVNKEDYSIIYVLPKGFLDFQVTPFDENCPDQGSPTGKIELKFLSTRQSGSYLIVNEQDGSEYSGGFEQQNLLSVNVPVGSYRMTLTHPDGYEHRINESFEVKQKESVEFGVPEPIDACLAYTFRPDASLKLAYTLQGPDGVLIRPSQTNGYELVQSGTYTLWGSDPTGNKCQTSKTFQATISQPANLNLDITPFCGDQAFTTIQLDAQGLLVHWFLLEEGKEVPLPWAEGYELLFVETEGDYLATLTDPEGCRVAEGQASVKRANVQAPALEQLYSICSAKKVGTTLQAGREFVQAEWYREGALVSTAPLFSIELEGAYTLVATDQAGCEHRVDFEVEDKCKSTLRYPNAIVPGNPEKAFMLYPDNLVEWLEVAIQNRWGELIYFCQDKNPISGKVSSCIWDGTIHGQRVINGSYSVQIRYGIKGHGEVVIERGGILVVD
ncbi:hypothetical protein ADIS_1826 [Lunatimonas lonarensis]|uniref:DUF7507 domain-containing protein n=1 Tax=Lunatimonas lonarensis TaxID=1232681 RepID=R7ZU72_9BACT|nr:DUF11 domain-containing protein [Lunatimonas lonarensis]EON77607.1 hypothetical protein ADIS_1826 [Lunatimonas lonarensis]